MVSMDTRIYDCDITPGAKRCKGFVEGINPVELNWEEFFSNVERHQDGSYLLIVTPECSIMVLKTGYYDIIQAKNEKVVQKYIDMISEVIKSGISQ